MTESRVENMTTVPAVRAPRSCDRVWRCPCGRAIRGPVAFRHRRRCLFQFAGPAVLVEPSLVVGRCA